MNLIIRTAVNQALYYGYLMAALNEAIERNKELEAQFANDYAAALAREMKEDYLERIRQLSDELKRLRTESARPGT